MCSASSLKYDNVDLMVSMLNFQPINSNRYLYSIVLSTLQSWSTKETSDKKEFYFIIVPFCFISQETDSLGVSAPLISLMKTLNVPLSSNLTSLLQAIHKKVS